MRILLVLLLLALTRVLPAQRTPIIIENKYRAEISPEGKLTGHKVAIEQKACDLQGRYRWQFFYDDSIPSIVKRNIDFFYDSLKLISKEIHGRNNVLKQVDRYFYSKEGKLTGIKTYEIKDNKPVLLNHTVFSDYTDTIPSSIVTFNSGGKWIVRTKVSFNGNEKTRKTQFRKGQNDENLKTEIHNYVMSDNSIVTERILKKFYGKTPPVTEMVKYNYGDDSLQIRPVKKIFTDKNGKLLQTNVYGYTKDGHFKSEKTYDSDGRLKNEIFSERARRDVTFQRKNKMFPIN